MSDWIRGVTVAAILSGAALWCAAEDEPAPAQPVAVLDTAGVWRIYQTLKPPVIEFTDGVKPVLTAWNWLNKETPEPAGDWRQPGFDDRTWLRGSARAAAQTPYLARLCLRGKFEVTDPSQVHDLRLTVTYYGGAIVSLNGRELARANVRQGGQLADGYPPEAFVGDDGQILPTGWRLNDKPKALAARERKLADVAIPSAALVKGVNVLAIEIVRAPYHQVVDEKKAAPVAADEGAARPAGRDEVVQRGSPYDLSWNTCEIRQVQLTAAKADGLVPNAARPEGFQVWTSDLMTGDFDSDFGDRSEQPGPLVIQGARNGWFSGKVVAGSPGPITGLKAVASDLKQGEAAIPASQIRIRYAAPWERCPTSEGAVPRGAAFLDKLLESPLAEFPAGNSGAAVVPIWITVHVPRDARPGEYNGQVTVEAAGQKPVPIGVRLSVADWALPDTQDWRTWVEMIQSPDTLVAEYGMPFWSDRHWEMIAQAMRYIGEVGSRVVYIPLICHTNFGNEQSMVRWIKKDDGTLSYDFSVMDKYLDLAERQMGKPKLVVFPVWEIYLSPPKEEVVVKEDDSSYIRMEKSWAAARWELRGKGPAVTALNPSTGELATVYLPRYETPEAAGLWKPLFDQLHERMRSRGLEKAMALGMASDAWPTKAELTVLQQVSGNLPWVEHTHGGTRIGQKMQGLADFAYIAYVWNCELAPDLGRPPTYGWKRPDLMAQYMRFEAINRWPPASMLYFGELNIAGQQRGVGRIGADFWAAIKDKRDQRVGWVWDRYLQSKWHSMNLSSHLLAPGPDGPVATTRYEVFRQGIEQCEARIAVERATSDDTLRARLGSDLARRCQEVLDERTWTMWKATSDLQLTGHSYASSLVNRYSIGGVAGQSWFAGTDWQAQSEKLFALAGEVEGKLRGPQ